MPSWIKCTISDCVEADALGDLTDDHQRIQIEVLTYPQMLIQQYEYAAWAVKQVTEYAATNNIEVNYQELFFNTVLKDLYYVLSLWVDHNVENRDNVEECDIGSEHFYIYHQHDDIQAIELSILNLLQPTDNMYERSGRTSDGFIFGHVDKVAEIHSSL